MNTCLSGPSRSNPGSCRTFHREPKEPRSAALTPSSRLCPAIIARERARWPARQMDQHGERHHRGTDDPDDLRDEMVKSKQKNQPNADDGEFDGDEKQPAGEEKAADLANGAALAP